VPKRTAHLQREVDLGVGVAELLEARQQHRARKRGRDGDAQLAPAGRGRVARKLLQRGQAVAHMGQVLAAFGGE